MSAADLAPLGVPPSQGPGPLAPCEPGRWDDGGLVVVRRSAIGAHPRGGAAPADVGVAHHAADFAISRTPDRVVVAHDLLASQIDNALATQVAEQLVTSGALLGEDVVGRVVTGVIRTMHPDPVAAWSLFYGNSLGRFASPAGHGGNALDVFGRIYRHAARLAKGTCLLDVGSCLGFLPLSLAARGGNRVIATDLLPAASQLLAAVAAHMDVALWSIPADGCALPIAAEAVDTAYAVHVLEHLDEAAGTRALAELQRVARCRVVVAVPVEAVPIPAFGQVRSFDVDVLSRIGAASGWRWRVDELEGAWLVLDRP